MSAAQLLPRPIPGIDPTTLPIGPREAFVLSQIDGTVSAADLSAGTGLDEATVSTILLRLEALGAIHFADSHPERRTSPPASSGSTKTSSVRLRAVSPTTDERPPTRPPSSPLDPEVSLTMEHSGVTRRAAYDEALLDEAGDIPRETKAEILATHARLERDNHYQLLGIAEDSDRKTIKAAYFEKVSVFHADRFFGKDLGEFKPRIERIFAALTKAHDTLTRAAPRADYDKYLQSRRATRGVTDSLPPSGIPAADTLEAPVIPRAPRAPDLGQVNADAAKALLDLEPVETSDDSPLELVPSSRAPAQAAGPITPADTPRSSGAAPESPVGRPSAPRSLDPAAARRLLARKLGHRASPQPVNTDREQVKKAVGEQLRQRYEARNSAANHQVNRYVEMAEQARAKREWGSSLNLLRTALSLEPNDARLADLLEEIQEEADRAMADQFVEQAKYEEADGHFERAARSYERAARGKSGESHIERAAPLYERAAHCLMMARGDKRRIVELSRLAVTLDPKRVSARLVLAQAYDSAQMRTSAIGELTRALELDPKNEEAKALLKQMK